jgi:hypothetical protein
VAVRFDAANDRYTGTTGLPTGTTAWTALCWVYLSTDRNNYSNAFAVSDGTNYYSAGFAANGTVRYVGWEGADLNANVAPTDATAGAWTRLAVVRAAASSSVTLYWGDLTGTLQSRTGTGVPPSSPNTLYIGSDQFGSWLNGRVAGFKMWGDALTSGEVAAEFTQFDPVRATNLLRYHRFATASTADDSGNGRTLTAGSSATTTEADPAGVPETAAPIGKDGSDSGSGSESGTVSAVLTGADAGAGTETGSVAWLQSGTDAGSGSETGYVAQQQTGNDTGTGNEAGSLGATVTASDAGAGSETGAIAGIVDGGTDSGTGDEAGHIRIPGTDTGTGGETLDELTAEITAGDSGTGAEGGYVETLFGDLVISLYALHPTTGAAVPLPDFTQLTLSPERNGSGSITLRYPTVGLNFSLLRSTITSDRDLEVEIWTSGSSRGALRGYLQEAAGDDVSEDSVWTFAGGFLELRLAEAVVWPQPIVGVSDLGDEVKVVYGSIPEAQWDQLLDLGYIGRDDNEEALYVPQLVLDAVIAGDPVPVLADDKRELKFSAVTPGALVGFILTQARSRGTLADIAADFTAERDSSGTLWPRVISTKFSPGAGYDQILDRLVSLDLAEWAIEWDGTARVLRLWVPEGRGEDLTTGNRPVVLRRGRNLIESPRKWSVRESGTALLAIGGEGFYDDVSSPDAQTRRGRRIEVSASANNLQDETALAAFAQAQLPATTTGLLEVTHGIGFLPGEPRPIIAFNVGDWVYSQTSTTMDRLRVVQWTLTIDAGQNPSGTVTLNDTVQDALVRLQGRLNALTAGETVVGTSEPSQQEDTGTPLAPERVVVGSTAYLVDGVSHAAVTVSWEPVTQNTDGTAATDVAGYTAQYAYDAAPSEWVGVEAVGPARSSATFDASPGVQLACRVAAYDQNGNTSAWSEAVGHTTEDDTTPPGVPSTPQVSDWFGTVRIYWDGNTEAGTDMYAAAPDFSHVQVHVSTGSMFTPSATTQVGELRAYGTYAVIDLPYGVTQYVRLVAVDLRGNPSDPSAQGSATPQRLVNIDIGPNAIDRTQIIDGEIVNAKIANLAVNDAKILNLNVGKLISGYVEADMILSTGEVRSGDDPNNYSVLDTAGLRMVLAGQTRVEFNRVTGNALVTGTYQTALSGERFNLLPDGTMRIFGASGSDYGQLANDGGQWSAISRADSSGRRSRVDFAPDGLHIKYGSISQTGVVSQTRTQADFGLTYAVLNAPVTGIRVWRQFSPSDGSANRFHFLTATGSGDDDESVIHYYGRRAGSGDRGDTTDNLGLMRGAARGAAVLWDNNQISILGGTDSDYGRMVSDGLSSPSSGLLKTRPEEITRAIPGGARGVLQQAPAQAWYYLHDLKPRPEKPGVHVEKRMPDGSMQMVELDWQCPPKQPQMHFGPIAEDLQRISDKLVSTDSRGVLLTDLRDLIGVVWAAVADLDQDVSARLDRLENGPPPIVIEAETGDV